MIASGRGCGPSHKPNLVWISYPEPTVPYRIPVGVSILSVLSEYMAGLGRVARLVCWLLCLLPRQLMILHYGGVSVHDLRSRGNACRHTAGPPGSVCR